MRVLQIHNQYRPGWGGEDTVANLEADLLRRNGHEVERLSAWTGELDGVGPLKLMAAGLGTVWSFRGYGLVTDAIHRFSPDIIHVHNFFPLFSPSIYWASQPRRYSRGADVAQLQADLCEFAAASRGQAV